MTNPHPKTTHPSGGTAEYGASTKADSWEIDVDGFTIEGPMRAKPFQHALRKKLAHPVMEPFMGKLFRQIIQPGMTVLDIGAYLGRYTLIAARQVGATGRVYAFEPEPLNFSFLMRNISRNGLSGRVVVYPYAVGATSGMQTLYLDPATGSASSLFVRLRRDVEETSVKCVALDEIFDENVVPDVIKLDVEAGEIPALSGMERAISRCGRDLTMFVECFPHGLRTTGATPQHLVARLESLGLTVMVIDERRKRLLPVTSGVKFPWFVQVLLFLDRWVNLLCVRSAEHPLLGRRR